MIETYGLNKRYGRMTAVHDLTFGVRTPGR
jgi:hypothetical protein